MKDIVIIGAGGFGREVAWLIERINNESPTWKIKGFIDDNEQLWGKQEDNYKVLGGTDYLKKCGEIYAVCAVGSASVRKRIVVTLTLDDGTVQECAVLTIFPVDDKQYIALLPLDENGENDDGEVYIYRFQEVNGEPSLDNIMDDDEYERVADAFDELLDDSEYDELVDADDEN